MGGIRLTVGTPLGHQASCTKPELLQREEQEKSWATCYVSCATKQSTSAMSTRSVAFPSPSLKISASSPHVGLHAVVMTTER